MPAITDPSCKILVTGGNGFVATHIVGDLLKKGYSVRATVRTEAKGKHLLDIYKSFSDRLEIMAVGDMMNDGAFDEAVKGCGGILHTAAAVHLAADEPKDIIDPAIKGILGILESAQKYGSEIKRVVITSSCATIAVYPSPPVTVSETTFLWQPVVECEEKGRNASALSKYCASKILAEKAGWDFYAKNKSSLNWDLVMLNPPWVFGPWVHEVPSLDSLNSSNKILYEALIKGEFHAGSPLEFPGHGWVDVRDVSTAHVLALETPDASGERIIISAGSHVWQDWLDTAAKLTPQPYSKPLAKGENGVKHRNITFDASKGKRIFGFEYRTMEELTRDFLSQVESLGW